MDQDHRLQDWSVPHATPNIELRLDQFKFLWPCNFEVNGTATGRWIDKSMFW